jgi:hypothetical protein
MRALKRMRLFVEFTVVDERRELRDR